MRKKKKSLVFIITLLIMCFGIGYAYLTTTLSINGITDVDANNWDVYFDNANVTTGSVTGDQVIEAPTITSDTEVEFHVRLKEPGEFYEFTIDAKNDGTIDAMIESVSKKVNGGTSIPAYLNYTVTYEDDLEILNNHLLAHESLETYKVRVEYRNDIDPDDLPSTAQSLTLSFGVEYVQKDSSAVEIDHIPPFQLDTLDTVVSNILSGNIQDYHVGDSRTITLENGQTAYLRILNTTTPSECSSSGFSQSACGFVLGVKLPGTSGFCSASGEGSFDNHWSLSPIRTYANEEFFYQFPEILRNHIIDTNVISYYIVNNMDIGVGFVTTTDKFYLLDVYEICGDSVNNIGLTEKTRQFDYYSSLGITYSNISSAHLYGWTRSPAGNTLSWSLNEVYNSLENVSCFNALSRYVAFRVG